MKRNRIQSKNLLIIFLLLILVIGYSILSSTLKINGTAGINKNTWDIHWNEESIIETQGSVTATIPANVTDVEKKNVSFNVNLELPGDFYEFKIDAKNYGSIDGEITLSSTIVKNEDGEEIELPSYLNYSVKYLDGTIPQNGDVLKAGTSKTYIIRLEFKSSETTIPNSRPIDIITTIDKKQHKDTDHYEETKTNVKCEDGEMIGNSNWCYISSESTLCEQKFRYYTSDTTYVENGWATFNDLYGNPQRYYFENGYAKVGWHEENNKKYFFDNEDGDGNGYMNCNMLKNTKRGVDGTCYDFDANGNPHLSSGCETNLKINTCNFDSETINTGSGQRPWVWIADSLGLIDLGIWESTPTNYYYKYKIIVTENTPATLTGRVIVYNNGPNNGKFVIGFSPNKDINYENFTVSQTLNQTFSNSNSVVGCTDFESRAQDINVTITEPGEYYIKAVYYMTKKSWSAYSNTCSLKITQ